MQLAVTLRHSDLIGPFRRSGADVFVVGIEGLTHRFSQTFSLEEIASCQSKVQAAGGILWVALNGLYHPDQLPALEKAIDVLAKHPPERILFADTAVYMFAQSRGLTNRLIYHPETYVSATADLFFWHEQGIAGVVPTRETTLADLIMMGKNRPLPLIWVGHGAINMFHSRRPLLQHYLDHTDAPEKDTHLNKRLDLYETTREDAFPIFEDGYGTHVFRAKPLASFQELKQLMPIIDTMIIQTLFMEDDAVIQVLADYRAAMQGDNLTPLIEKYATVCDSGFYYKETVLEKLRGVRS